MSEIEGLAGDPEDTPDKVFNDIVTQGCYLNNRNSWSSMYVRPLDA